GQLRQPQRRRHAHPADDRQHPQPVLGQSAERLHARSLAQQPDRHAGRLAELRRHHQPHPRLHRPRHPQRHPPPHRQHRHPHPPPRHPHPPPLAPNQPHHPPRHLHPHHHRHQRRPHPQRHRHPHHRRSRHPRLHARSLAQQPG